MALVLRSWLLELFDNAKPFVSDHDIGAGARSMAVLEDELANTSFGIVVITKANQGAPWLNFEAGALSKEVADGQNRVIPLLMDMDSAAELTGPIAQFQAQKFDRTGMLRVVEAIATVIGANPEAVAQRFDRSWDDIGGKIAAIPADDTVVATTRRPMPDMVEETLTLVRQLEKRLAASGPVAQGPQGSIGTYGIGTYGSGTYGGGPQGAHFDSGTIGPRGSSGHLPNEEVRSAVTTIDALLKEMNVSGRVTATSTLGGWTMDVDTKGASPRQLQEVRATAKALPGMDDVSIHFSEPPF